jgi:hypothetical protein
MNLDTQHQARVDKSPIEYHIAGPAVAVVAALLRAGQMQLIAQHFQQALPGLAKKIDVFAVNCRL